MPEHGDDRVPVQEHCPHPGLQQPQLARPRRLIEKEVEVPPQVLPQHVDVHGHHLGPYGRVGVIPPRHRFASRVGPGENGRLALHFGRPPHHWAHGRRSEVCPVFGSGSVVGARLVLPQEGGGGADDLQEAVGEQLLAVGEVHERGRQAGQVRHPQVAHLQHGATEAAATAAVVVAVAQGVRGVVSGQAPRLQVDAADGGARILLPLEGRVARGERQGGQEGLVGSEETVGELGGVARAFVGQDGQHLVERDALDALAQTAAPAGSCGVEVKARVGKAVRVPLRTLHAVHRGVHAVGGHDVIEVFQAAGDIPQNVGRQAAQVTVSEHLEAHVHQAIQHEERTITQRGERPVDSRQVPAEEAQQRPEPATSVHPLLDGVPVTHVHTQVLAQGIQTVQLADRRLQHAAVANGISGPVLGVQQTFQLLHEHLSGTHAVHTVSQQLHPSPVLQQPAQLAVIAPEPDPTAAVHKMAAPVVRVPLAGVTAGPQHVEGLAQQLARVFRVAGIEHALREGHGVVPIPVKPVGLERDVGRLILVHRPGLADGVDGRQAAGGPGAAVALVHGFVHRAQGRPGPLLGSGTGLVSASHPCQQLPLWQFSFCLYHRLCWAARHGSV